MVTKRTTERLITTWREKNEQPSMVMPKELAYTGVLLYVSQDGVHDPRPRATSWKVVENGNMVVDRGW